MFRRRVALSCINVNRFVSVIAQCKEREVMGIWCFFFHVSNRHEQVLRKISMTFETCLLFMLYVENGFNNNKHTYLSMEY